MKIKHGVFITYGVTQVKLSANDLQLMADALGIVNPDTLKQENRARDLGAMFEALSEYVDSLKK